MAHEIGSLHGWVAGQQKARITIALSLEDGNERLSEDAVRRMIGRTVPVRFHDRDNQDGQIVDAEIGEDGRAVSLVVEEPTGDLTGRVVHISAALFR